VSSTGCILAELNRMVLVLEETLDTPHMADSMTTAGDNMLEGLELV